MSDQPGQNQAPKILRAGSLRFFRQPDSVDINWMLTNFCNFKCSYCIEHEYYNGRIIPKKDLLAAVARLDGLGGKKINLTLSGGEPTLHPGYIEFVQEMCERFDEKISIQTMTNLSRGEKFRDKLIERLSPFSGQVYFFATAHMEFVKMDRFVQNAMALSQAGFRVFVNVLAHPGFIPAVKRLDSLLARAAGPRLIRKEPRVVLEKQGSYPDLRYDPKDLEWLKSLGPRPDPGAKPAAPFFVDQLISEEGGDRVERSFHDKNSLILNDLHRFKGMLCNAGVNSLAVDQAGFIDRAVCFRGFPGEKPNIYDPNSRPDLGRPVRCPFATCSCGADLALPKYRPGHQTL